MIKMKEVQRGTQGKRRLSGVLLYFFEGAGWIANAPCMITRERGKLSTMKAPPLTWPPAKQPIERIDEP
ncbi:MAG: hypothetical protein DBX66_06250 [Clostridiales bacterium]|nr:MAG: hypothetical protein DBX66_06250 [Clostridiales bacterium]RGB64485.1 hypothetical protein DW086_12250 [Harryflintia acetispora]